MRTKSLCLAISVFATLAASQAKGSVENASVLRTAASPVVQSASGSRMLPNLDASSEFRLLALDDNGKATGRLSPPPPPPPPPPKRSDKCPRGDDDHGNDNNGGTQGNGGHDCRVDK